MPSDAEQNILDSIRREIDEIDDSLLALLMRRIAATGRVRAMKSADGGMPVSPLRPAREAQIIRRLMARADGTLDPATLVRLWRVILSSSVQAQASVTLHADEALSASPSLRDIITSHFPGLPLASHSGADEAISTLAARPLDLAIVATSSDWAAAVSGTGPREPQVIGALPAAAAKGAPSLLVIGIVAPQASGDDITLVISDRELPATGGPARCWSVRSGPVHVTGLAGFLTRDSAAFRALADQQPGLRIAGYMPSPIEVSP